MKQYISLFFIVLYGVVLSHDFIPHHHSEIYCKTHHHSHNDCDHSEDCSFPFHQHNMDEAGVFLNNSSVDVNLECKLVFIESYQIEIDEQLKTILHFPNFLSSIYKGPDLGSSALRAPPVC